MTESWSAVSKEPPRWVPDPLTSEQFTLVWRGEAVLVNRVGPQWAVKRAGRQVLGPPVVAVERWSGTVERIKVWLDVHMAGEAR